MSTKEDRLQVLRSKVKEGAHLLDLAETDLQQQVNLLKPVLTGDKQVSTEGLERSFERLIAARRVLNDLEDLLTETGKE